MRRFLIGLLATIGGLALLVILAGGVVVWRFMAQVEALPDRILLTADWRSSLSETAGAPDLLALELRPPPTVTDTVMALDAAAGDPRVAGILVRLAETEHGLAVAQELRDAVRRFRAGGKYAIAYADTFGELGSGNEGYYLATAFDEIELQQIGLVGLTGIAAQVPFARDLLASLGVRFEVLRRAEYKSALDSLTDSQLSAPNREQLEALLDTLSAQLVSGIAEGRKLAPEEVRRLIDQGPFTGEAALAAGLIDFVRYQDESLKLALRRAGADAATVPLEVYANSVAVPAQPAAGVALIRASGLIRRGSGPLGSEIAADELAETLRDIAEDPGLAALLLRIDSGGGSAVASETIRRAALGSARGREAGDRFHEQHRGLGRLLDCGGCGPDHRPAGDADRLDRRARRQARARGSLAQAGRELGRGDPRGQCRHLVDQQALLGRGPGPRRRAGRLALRPLHQAGVGRTRHAAGSRAGARPGAGVGRRGGGGTGAGRRARRFRRGAGGGAQVASAAARRATRHRGAAGGGQSAATVPALAEPDRGTNSGQSSASWWSPTQARRPACP